MPFHPFGMFFSTAADMDVCVCVLLQWRKAAKARRTKGLNTTISKYVYISYSIHVWHFSLHDLHTRTLIGINYKSHPCINISF